MKWIENFHSRLLVSCASKDLFWLINVVNFQCFPKASTTTKFYSSSSAAAATPKAKKQIEEERISHEDRVVNITKLSIQELQPEIAKIQKLQAENERLQAEAVAGSVANDDKIRQKTSKKKEELPWRITPAAEPGQLVNNYLMLSKIRLTCEFCIYGELGRTLTDLKLFNSFGGDNIDGWLRDGTCSI